MLFQMYILCVGYFISVGMCVSVCCLLVCACMCADTNIQPIVESRRLSKGLSSMDLCLFCLSQGLCLQLELTVSTRPAGPWGPLSPSSQS